MRADAVPLQSMREDPLILRLPGYGKEIPRMKAAHTARRIFAKAALLMFVIQLNKSRSQMNSFGSCR